MTILLPAQIATQPGSGAAFEPFFVVGAFVDCAKILGLPKLRLRDKNGNPYLPDKAMSQEPLAQILSSANIVISELEIHSVVYKKVDRHKGQYSTLRK